MYRRAETKLTLDKVLSKIEHPNEVYEPVVYTPHEVNTARTVLERLLKTAPVCEVASIETVTEDNYDEER